MRHAVRAPRLLRDDDIGMICSPSVIPRSAHLCHAPRVRAATAEHHCAPCITPRCVQRKAPLVRRGSASTSATRHTTLHLSSIPTHLRAHRPPQNTHLPIFPNISAPCIPQEVPAHTRCTSSHGHAERQWSSTLCCTATVNWR